MDVCVGGRATARTTRPKLRARQTQGHYDVSPTVNLLRCNWVVEGGCCTRQVTRGKIGNKTQQNVHGQVKTLLLGQFTLC